jgi:hypothetical protein
MATKCWHALVLLGVVLGFSASFVLLGRVIGRGSPWLVLLLMFYVLGFMKVAEPLFMLRMPRSLRPLRRWEVEGNVYRRLRVPAFGRVLRRSLLRYLNTAVYLDHGRRDLAQVRRQAEAAEAAHLLAGILVLPYIVYAAMQGRWLVAAGFSLADLLVNAYPLLHLRHTRGRLERLGDRL